MSHRAKRCPRCKKRQTVQGPKAKAAGVSQCISRDCGGFFDDAGPLSSRDGLDRLGYRQARQDEAQAADSVAGGGKDGAP